MPKNIHLEFVLFIFFNFIYALVSECITIAGHMGELSKDYMQNIQTLLFLKILINAFM